MKEQVSYRRLNRAELRQEPKIQVICLDCGSRLNTYPFFIEKGCNKCGGEIIQDSTEKSDG